MHAGTPEQEAAIKEWEAQGNTYDYTKVCNYLKEIGLYEVPVSTIGLKANPSYAEKDPDSMYKYGHGWLKEDIPEKDVLRIESLVKTGEKYMGLDKEKGEELEMDM